MLPDLRRLQEAMTAPLDRIRQYVEAATPGPWHRHYNDRHIIQNEEQIVVALITDAPAIHANAEYIASARTDLPRLLAIAQAAHEIDFHELHLGLDWMTNETGHPAEHERQALERLQDALNQLT